MKLTRPRTRPEGSREENVLDSPYRFTALIIAGGALAAGGSLIGLRLFPHNPLALIAFDTLISVGLLGMFWAAHTLRDDIANERWPETTLAPFRRVIDSVLWKVAMALLVLAMFAALTQDRHHRTWFWAIFVLLQTQTQIGTAFARPRNPNRQGSLLHRSKVAPLRSEHWGER